MCGEITLISHKIGKKRTAAEALLSPISPIGESVITSCPLTTTKAISKCQRFKSKILRCFRKPEPFFSTPISNKWEAHPSSDVKDSRCSGDKNITSIGSVSNLKAYGSYACSCSKMQPRKHLFRMWLNEKNSILSKKGQSLVVKDVFAAAAEESAIVASIRKNTKDLVKIVSVTAAAHARVNAVLFKLSINQTSAMNIIKHACEDVLEVSPVPKWKNADYVKLFSLYHYKLSSVESYIHKFPYALLLEESVLRDEFDECVIGSLLQENNDKNKSNSLLSVECRQVEIPKTRGKVGKNTNNGASNSSYETIKRCGMLSNTPSFDYEVGTSVRKDNKFFKRLEEWMKSLISRMDSFGEASEIVHTVGGGIEEKANAVEEIDNSQNSLFEKDSSGIGEENYFNPCMLDNSWRDVFLPCVEDGSLSFNRIARKGSNAVPIRKSIFSHHFGRPFNHNIFMSEVNSNIASEENQDKTGVITGEYKGVGTIVHKEASSCWNSNLLSPEDSVGNFSEANIRIEALNSQFDQINSRVEQIVLGLSLREEVQKDSSKDNGRQSLVVDGISGLFSALGNNQEILDIPDKLVEECMHEQNQLPENYSKFKKNIDKSQFIRGKNDESSLNINTEKSVLQINELLSLIDDEIMPLNKQPTKLRYQSFSTPDIQIAMDGRMKVDNIASGNQEKLAISKNKDQEPLRSLFLNNHSQNSGISQVYELLEQIDSVIMSLESNC